MSITETIRECDEHIETIKQLQQQLDQSKSIQATYEQQLLELQHTNEQILVINNKLKTESGPFFQELLTDCEHHKKVNATITLENKVKCDAYVREIEEWKVKYTTASEEMERCKAEVSRLQSEVDRLSTLPLSSAVPTLAAYAPSTAITVEGADAGEREKARETLRAELTAEIEQTIAIQASQQRVDDQIQAAIELDVLLQEHATVEKKWAEEKALLQATITELDTAYRTLQESTAAVTKYERDLATQQVAAAEAKCAMLQKSYDDLSSTYQQQLQAQSSAATLATREVGNARSSDTAATQVLVSQLSLATTEIESLRAKEKEVCGSSCAYIDASND